MSCCLAYTPVLKRALYAMRPPCRKLMDARVCVAEVQPFGIYIAIATCSFAANVYTYILWGDKWSPSTTRYALRVCVQLSSFCAGCSIRPGSIDVPLFSQCMKNGYAV